MLLLSLLHGNGLLLLLFGLLLLRDLANLLGAFIQSDQEVKVLLVELGLRDWRKFDRRGRSFDLLKLGVEAVDLLPEVLCLEVDARLQLLLLNELVQTIFVHVSHQLVEHLRLVLGHVLEELGKLVDRDLDGLATRA